MSATFLKTQRNGQKLVFENFTYNKVKDGANGKQYWRCDQKRSKCKGSAITDNENKVTVAKKHNHAPSHIDIEVKTIRDAIKQAAVSTTLAPREIVSAAVGRINEAALLHLPELKNLRKSISRARKSMNITPANPRGIDEIVLSPQMSVTPTGENFVLEDTGSSDPNRIIILGTKIDLSRLSQCEIWTIDSTFTANLDSWYNLWIIHGIYFERTVPLVYCILPNRLQETYERVLDSIFIKIDEIDLGKRPSCVLIDYEKASEEAFRKLIPEIDICGCLFHFTRAIWNEMQKLKITELFNSDDYFRTVMKSFSALAFVPPEDVESSFELLAEEFLENFGQDESNQRFVDYFVNTWVGRTYEPSISPLFPIEMWNCHNITLEGLPLASNTPESWHFEFAAIFSSHHTNFNKIIEGLIKEEAKANNVCSKLENGKAIELYTRKEYRQANEKLLSVISDYANKDIGEFLRTCSYFINYAE